MEDGARIEAPMLNISASNIRMEANSQLSATSEMHISADTSVALDSSSLSTFGIVEIRAPGVFLAGLSSLTGQRVNILSCGDIIVGSSVRITTSGRGYGFAEGPGYDSETECAYHSSRYGNRTFPTELGSGGGHSSGARGLTTPNPSQHRYGGAWGSSTRCEFQA